MALKIDKELVSDAKTENRLNHGKNQNSDPNPEMNNSGSEETKKPEPEETKKPESEPIQNAKQENNSSANSGQNTGTENNSSAGSNEFKEKFEEYFKGAGSIIAGGAITELVDDFKTKLLFIYAKKNGVDIPMETLKMDPKSKEFCSFLIDYAIKNKLFGFIEKYPLIAAGGVVALSGVSSYLFVEMMKKGNEETAKHKKENADLKAKLARFENAQTVKDENETSNTETAADDIVSKTIENLG